MCYDGVDYFDYATAVAELVDSGHLALEDGLYSTTEKGRRNGTILREQFILFGAR
jgi:hypothetical protein